MLIFYSLGQGFKTNILSILVYRSVVNQHCFVEERRLTEFDLES